MDDHLIDQLVAHHAAEGDETVETLLHGVPEEGGSASRAIMEQVVRAAFMGGLAAQFDRPYRVPAPSGVKARRCIVVKGGNGLASGNSGLIRLRASTGETWHVVENATLPELLAEGFTLRIEDAAAGRPLVLFKPE